MARKTFFCDTSVLFAASDAAHMHHSQSLEIVARAKKEYAFCALHSIAELYSGLTAMPVPKMRRVEDVFAGVEQAIRLFTTVSLTEREYLWVLQHAKELGIRSGQTYDALILKCAEKSGASEIYTWNESHFVRVAWPSIREKIRAPGNQLVY